MSQKRKMCEYLCNKFYRRYGTAYLPNAQEFIVAIYSRRIYIVWNLSFSFMGRSETFINSHKFRSLC